MGKHILLMVALCAASIYGVPAVAQDAIVSPVQVERPTLKRKVAIGRFSNATRYGKALLLSNEEDPLAKQASDMLTARLVDSGKFIVFERSDVDAIQKEQAVNGATQKLVGVDALIVGSVTEFGRKVEGQSGFLNSKMRQVASATVEVRLVDVATGHAFFSTKGQGSAVVEAKEIAGFGSQAGYDSTLNDKAISSAISDLMTNVINRLSERRWVSDVLRVSDNQVLISGGPSQGLKIGDVLRIETIGETLTSGQTGLPITLPGQVLGKVRIVSFFGEDKMSEGAVTTLVEGKITGDAKTMIVVEDK